MRRARAVGFVVALLVLVTASCDGEPAADTGTTTRTAPSGPTTSANTTTTVLTTTTTLEVSTTAAVDLSLRLDGIGVTDFGTQAETALSTLEPLLGPPDRFLESVFNDC